MNVRYTYLLCVAGALALLSACSFDLERLSNSAGTPVTTPIVATGSLQSSAYDTLSMLEKTEVPQRDLIALAQRLLEMGEIPVIARTTPYAYGLGDEESFWIADTDANLRHRIKAVLQHITPHLFVWVEKGAQVDLDALRSSADLFEERTYATTRRYFGSEWSPGVDSDVHLNILHAHGLGDTVAGYYSSSDEFSRLAHEFSNEREMFYVNLDTVTIGGAFYDGLLAHEFQHMIHWHADRNEELWINEGLSKLAEHLNGFGSGSDGIAFLAQPDVQLNDFSYGDSTGSAHYGSAFLFALYFLERFGEETTQALVAHPAGGIAGIDAVLSQLNDGCVGQCRATPNLKSVFSDWAAALYLDEPDLGDGRYGFQSLSLGRPTLSADLSNYPVAYHGSTVHQFASDYLRLTGTSPVTMIFTGTRQVRVVSTDPHSGAFHWWSNRGDSTNTTLTRAFDCTGLNTITLDYWLWYDIEEDWDYAYLEISTDSGRTWDTIQTPHTTDTDPSGNNYGHGYTGTSGGDSEPQWIREQVELSTYSGQRLLVRFEYVTDGAISESGLVLDDFSIPELEYEEDFEEDDPAWEASGFVRNSNVLPQHFVVQLVELGAKRRVRRLPLNAQGRARWNIPLDQDTNEIVLIISAVTPVTSEPASYAYRVTGGHPDD